IGNLGEEGDGGSRRSIAVAGRKHRTTATLQVLSYTLLYRDSLLVASILLYRDVLNLGTTECDCLRQQRS
ncbi:MAG TPA: hypothetical protein V6D26_18490, partial [Stenomitos sp.]